MKVGKEKVEVLRYFCERWGKKYTRKYDCEEHERRCCCRHEFFISHMGAYYITLQCSNCRLSRDFNFVNEDNNRKSLLDFMQDGSKNQILKYTERYS